MEPLQPQQNNKNMFSTRSNNIFIENPNLKILLLILIGVFLFSGIGLTIYAQWSAGFRQKVYEETKAGLPQHKTSPSASQQVSSQSESIEGWKTYKNDEYGFEFQYPPSYITTGKKAINSTLGTAQVNVGGVYLGPLVIVPLTSQDLVKQAKEYMLQDCGKNKVVNDIQINYLDCGDGGPAYYGYIHGPKVDFFIDGYSCGWSSIDCGDVYNNGPGRFISMAELEKILSTFKFTSQTDTSNWKTYKNDQYGFEFDYPADWQFNKQSDTEVKVSSSPYSDPTQAPNLFLDMTISNLQSTEQIKSLYLQDYQKCKFECLEPSFRDLNYGGIAYLDSGAIDGTINSTYYFPLIESGKMIVFRFEDQKVPGFTEKREKIISTFKFTK